MDHERRGVPDFCDTVSSAGATPLTDADTYLTCHHLPNGYPLISEFTPRTIVFPPDVDLKSELDALDWDGYFIKDYVKSLKTEAGSLLCSTEHVEQLVSLVQDLGYGPCARVHFACQ